jgi:hypothetical protein
MTSAFEQLESLIQTPEYKILDEAVQRDFVLASNALAASYTNDGYWVTLNGTKTINNSDWQIRIGRFITGLTINEVPVKIAFASLIPRPEVKQVLKGDKASHAYAEALEEYSSTIFSADFAQVRLFIGTLFQKLHPGNEYFLFPMNQSYGLLELYDYDLILPYFDILSFKAALKP